MIRRMMAAGMDVVRLNFSHGTHEDHALRINSVRQASAHFQKPVAILADLQGPKIRTGDLVGGKPIRLRFGQRFFITTKKTVGTPEGVSTTFKGLPEAVKKGDLILLRDGEIALRVLSSRAGEVVTQVENGGDLGEHQGINLPGVTLKIPALTPKDRVDLAFALENDVNYIALSFVRTAGDVKTAKSLIARSGKNVRVIAKLEKPEAIDNLEEILAVADGVMVARGDLGVELSPEKVPVIQKRIITAARNALVPVITATQMLDSMQKNPRPTRAEASDVANAVFDGTDALMLSGETAAGSYPLESVEMMNRIICEAEQNVTQTLRPVRAEAIRISEAISEAVCHAAEELSMKLVVVFTETGFSAKVVSKYRPPVPIIAFSPRTDTRRRVSLFWGVVPKRIVGIDSVDQLAEVVESRLREEKLVKTGDIVGIICGTPFGARGTTNLLRLLRIGGAKAYSASV
jgi:pyruvate kinase